MADITFPVAATLIGCAIVLAAVLAAFIIQYFKRPSTYKEPIADIDNRLLHIEIIITQHHDATTALAQATNERYGVIAKDYQKIEDKLERTTDLLIRYLSRIDKGD